MQKYYSCLVKYLEMSENMKKFLELEYDILSNFDNWHFV
jgi:hypothetical protein